MYFSYGYVPPELFVFWSIFSIGLASAVVSHFYFWLEKRKPFFYLFIKKDVVLLIVENPGFWVRLAQRVGGASCWNCTYC
jgi:hypothetical protein